MNQKLLFKLSLTISLIGIISLLILSNILEPKLKNISEINNNHINKKTKIQGKIINTKNFEKHNFQLITITDQTAEIDVLIQGQKKPSQFQINQQLIITGKIQSYQDTLQIQAEKISTSPYSKQQQIKQKIQTKLKNQYQSKL